MKPRYFDKGITAYWLDETDGEGTAGGDGVHGYDTTYGPAAAASNLWVNDWLSLFTEPVRGVELRLHQNITPQWIFPRRAY